MESLLDAVGAGEDEAPFFMYVIEVAKETSTTESQAGSISLTDSLRLIGRIDANTRQVEADARAEVKEVAMAKVDKHDAMKRQKIFTVQDGFTRIEDAVCGLTHKISSVEEGTSPKNYSAWPPSPPVKSAI